MARTKMTDDEKKLARRESQKRWREKNREKYVFKYKKEAELKVKSGFYQDDYIKHADKKRERSRAYYAKNKDIMKEKAIAAKQRKLNGEPSLLEQRRMKNYQFLRKETIYKQVNALNIIGIARGRR